MTNADTNVDRLLKARTEIDKELRRLKSSLTVLFTDVVGSTAYFDRYGDTAGVAMLGRHAGEVRAIVRRFEGRVVKTIGDSVMAEFPNPRAGICAAAEIQRRQFVINRDAPAHEMIQIRIGVNTGLGYRKDEDVYGDVVNLAARLTKRSGPAQILVSEGMVKKAGQIEGIEFVHLGKVTVEGRKDKDDLFEVVWTSPAEYAELRRATSAALVRGEIAPRPLQAQQYSSPFPVPSVGGPPHLFDTPPPAPLELTNRYDLLEELGRGGMGIVYKARDRETGDLVALKLLKPEIAADQAVMNRFKNELRLARKITHKNVCRIYEFNRAGGTGFISMEYVEGDSLRAALARYGTMSVQKAVDIARQICSGLEEAHNQGVVHRDLKPENVMVDTNGQVKIMDFGIARSVAMTLTQTGSTLGTPAYMAPEQAEGEKVDNRTDIYAVGLIFFEMLVGRQVFKGDTAAQIAYKQVHEVPPALRDVDKALPAVLESVVSRCLAKHPDDRFQTVEALRAELVETAEATATSVDMTAAEPVRQAAAPIRVSVASGSLRMAVGRLVLIAAVVVLAWGLWANRAAMLFPDSTGDVPAHASVKEQNGDETAMTVASESGEAPGDSPSPGESTQQQAALGELPASQPVAQRPVERIPPPPGRPTATVPARAVGDSQRSREEPLAPVKSEVLRPVNLAAPEPEDESKPLEESIPASAADNRPLGQAAGVATESEPTVEPLKPSTPPPVPPAAGNASLEVRAYQHERDAVRLHDKLIKSGFPSTVDHQENESVYRVLVGPFDNLDVARAAQRRLEALGYKSILRVGDN